MHPGALANAVDDFDADLAVARATAASSGNGATIAVLPRVDASGAHSGFILRVYRGRPNAAGAVQPTTAMPIESSATVVERTFGKPPFSIFLSSAGHPSGLASYPAVDTKGEPSFNAIASQPPCPVGGIVLTFTSPQGATQTRTLQCADSVSGVQAPNPSPTPNLPVVTPSQLVAHWTTDNTALHFAAAEFGYTHWFASAAGTACGAVARYDFGWPYSTAPDPNEPRLAPNPPNAPYSWPNASSMNDAPASFSMSPIAGSPGLCAVDIVDDYGQHAGAAVQVMGDLTPAPASLTFNSPLGAAQDVAFGKTFDSENLSLKTTDNCAGIATYAVTASSTPSSPSTTPALAVLKVTPSAAGQCDIRAGDQYGEPPVDVHITVTNSVLAVWPPAIEFPVAGSQLANTNRDRLNVAMALNYLLGGSTADASVTPCAINQPRAFPSAASMTADSTPLTNTSDPWGLGIKTDSNGCLSGPSGAVVAVHEANYAGGFKISQDCGAALQSRGWYPSALAPTAGYVVMGGSSAVSACEITVLDQNVTIQKAAVAAAVSSSFCNPANGDSCAIVGHSFFQCYSWAGTRTDRTCIDSAAYHETFYYKSLDGGRAWIPTGASFSNDDDPNSNARIVCPLGWGQQSINGTPEYSVDFGSAEAGPLSGVWQPSIPPGLPPTEAGCNTPPAP